MCMAACIGQEGQASTLAAGAAPATIPTRRASGTAIADTGDGAKSAQLGA
jgi:hypothetical protein